MKLSWLLCGALALTISVPAMAGTTKIGDILACYACNTTGNPAVDAALAAHPEVAGDGLLFAFVNTSSQAITNGTFSVSNSNPSDSFSLPTIAANSTYIFIPGETADAALHPAGGLFGTTGAMDTSDGAGGVTDASIFRLIATQGMKSVTLTTAGTSTAIVGTFTAADPGLFQPYRDNPSYSTSFLGNGPNGDGGCSNCYFHEVATLNIPSASGTVPEPASWALMLAGFGVVGGVMRRRETAISVAA